MKPEPMFKVGDTVRRKSGVTSNAYLVGTKAFNVAGIDQRGLVIDPNGQRHPQYSLMAVDARLEHFKDLATLGNQLGIESTPPVDEYNDPNRERLLRQIDDLNAVLRRRNETITELRKLLDESTPPSALSNLADQLGMRDEEASKALELGGYLLAQGFTREDIDFWRQVEIRLLSQRQGRK